MQGIGNDIPMTHDQRQKILQHGLCIEGVLKNHVVSANHRKIFAWAHNLGTTNQSSQEAIQLFEAGHTVASTNTSLNVCAGFSREDTRCKGAAIADSHSMSFIENSAFCASNACPEQSRRVPCGEAGRKAGCRKSARPV